MVSLAAEEVKRKLKIRKASRLALLAACLLATEGLMFPAFATTYPNLNAFYPSSCGTNTSATLIATINHAFSVTNSGGLGPTGTGVFEVDMAATAAPSGGITPVVLELAFLFKGYEPYYVGLSGNIPGNNPSGVHVTQSLSSSINVSSAVGDQLAIGWYWSSPNMNYWVEILNSLGQVIFAYSNSFQSNSAAQWGMTAFIPSISGVNLGTATFANANFALSGQISNNAGIDSSKSVYQTGQGTQPSICGFTPEPSGELANIGTSGPSASGISYAAKAP